MKAQWALVLLVGMLALWQPSIGSAEQAGGAAMGGAKVTLSLTKDYTASPWTHETGYWNRFGHKLGFGVKNLLLGWTDLFSEPKQASEANGNVWKGIGVGIKDTIENEVGGVVHIITSPVTSVDAPLPEGGVQL